MRVLEYRTDWHTNTAHTWVLEDCTDWHANTAHTWIFGRKALGLRSRMDSTAAWRTCSLSLLLQQLTQLQLSQYRPLAKHSQYSLRQREFLQLQCFLMGPVSVTTFATLGLGRGLQEHPGRSQASIVYAWLGQLSLRQHNFLQLQYLLIDPINVATSDT